MIDDQLIKKYFKNQCSDEEADLVYRYLTDYPEVLEDYIPLNEILKETGSAISPAITDKILEHIRKEMATPKKRFFFIKPFMRWAAAVAAILVMVMGLHYWSGQHAQKRVDVISHISSAGEQMILKENKTNKVLEVPLPDGSLVTLYPKSGLKYAAGFTKDKRELYLQGKARFKVEHEQQGRSFTVYVSDIATTDIGTTFVIEELKRNKVSVELIEGSVKVWERHRKTGRGVMLTAGQKMIVQQGHFKDYVILDNIKEKTRLGLKETKQKAVTTEIIELGPLEFKNTPLKTVFDKVGSRFGVQFEYDSNVGVEDKLFTGTFLKNDSLAFICKVICQAHGLSYEVQADKVMIHD